MKIPPFNRHEVTWATSDLYSSGCKEASLPEKRRSVGLCYVRSYIGGAGNSMLSACPSVCAYVRARAGVISDRFAGVFWFLVVFKTFDFFFAYNYSYTVFKCMSVIYVHVCMVDKLNPGENLALDSPSKMLSYMKSHQTSSGFVYIQSVRLLLPLHSINVPSHYAASELLIPVYTHDC